MLWQLFKRLLKTLLFAPVALFLLFEEWGWEPLAAAFVRLGGLPIWAAFERLIGRLPPWAALLAFTVPVLVLIPVKLLALYLLGLGHVVIGMALIILAKIAGTAIAARLFQLTFPALMQLPWFARFYPPWKAWKDGKLRLVRASFAWRFGRRLQHRWTAASRRLLAFLNSLVRPG